MLNAVQFITVVWIR